MRVDMEDGVVHWGIMSGIRATNERRQGNRNTLVQETSDAMRQMIFDHEPGACIGSLPDLALKLGVGIVTIQQAARILEHEGLLDVRRGPKGGYFGTRPDAAVLERALAAYMRTYPASWPEALDMTSLLFNELAAAAANSRDKELQRELAEFVLSVRECSSAAEASEMEGQFQTLLFRMVNRPLFELLTRVTLRFGADAQAHGLADASFDLEQWKAGRVAIIAAILQGDDELARFEANRQNRSAVLTMVQAARRDSES